jgi:hypothetical protein
MKINKTIIIIKLLITHRIMKKKLCGKKILSILSDKK